MVRSLEGKHPKYFEAILQLRDTSDEVKAWVDQEIKNLNIVVPRVERAKKTKNGWDYYLADNNQGRQIGSRLQQKFGGHYCVTASLHTTIDSKEKYRVTILFREAPYRKNDVVDYHGEEFTIKMMSKDIFLQNNKTGKKIHVKYKFMDKIKKIN
jgi:NMD protein affecting ribosome stability and mRNA decay